MHCRYYASPKSQIQKIQNLTIVLRFLKEEEKIQLKGISKFVYIIVIQGLNAPTTISVH